MLANRTNGDFPRGRLMFQPDTQNVAGGIDVPVVDGTATATFPVSHSERAHTFRTALGNVPAARARPGSPTLVGLDKHRSVPSGLVPEHVSEIAPSCIHHGFSHPCFRKPGSAHIADRDVVIGTHNPRGMFVQMMASRVGDLCVDRADSLFIPRPLSDSEFFRELPIVADVFNHVPVAGCGKGFQPEIYTYHTLSGGQVIGHFTRKRYIPAPSGVLDKSAAFVDAFNLSRLPKGVAALKHGRDVAANLYGPRDERYPAKRSFGPKTRSKTRALSMKVSRLYKLATCLIDTIGVNAEQKCAAINKAAEGEFIWPLRPRPTSVAPLGFTLNRHTEIPNLIYGDRSLAQMSVTALNAVLEADHRHVKVLADWVEKRKSIRQPTNNSAPARVGAIQ